MKERSASRVFLAIDLPPEVHRKIAEIQIKLKKDFIGNIRWVNPKGMHLTMKFFGNVFNDEIEKISSAVKYCTNGVEQFSLYVKRVGVFPDPRRPRVLWLGISGDTEPLRQFQRNISQELDKCGFKAEERPFIPHLTLARIKEQKGLIGLDKILEKRDNCEAGHFEVSGLTFFESKLTPQGAVYNKLAYFPFIQVK